MDFARNGLMNEFPEGLDPPLELEDRKTVLETMLYRPPENSRLYLMDPEKTTVSDEFVFSLAKGKRIMTYRKRLPKLRMFCFQEQNLMGAFEDFFESLPESSYVLPRSEVERVLRQAIRCCDGLLYTSPNNRLVQVPNVIAMPHLGASTPESEANCAAMAAQELRDYLENGNISNSVNPVSYTHLDVYKRQTCSSTSPRARRTICLSRS